MKKQILFYGLCSLFAFAVSVSTLFSQETPVEKLDISEGLGFKTDKSSTSTHITPGNALINGLTVGLGGGSNATNAAFGVRALESNKSGYNNTAIGGGALLSNQSGIENTALGFFSLLSNTGGGMNTALGSGTLAFSTTGSRNTAVGYMALSGNQTGYHNTAIGNETMRNNTTGYHNIALGSQALLSNTTGLFNVAMGSTALSSNTTGRFNVAIGHSVLRMSENGEYNVGIGNLALYWNETGSHNVAIGRAAHVNNKTGNSNIAIGVRTLFYSKDKSGLVAIGDSALFYNEYTDWIPDNGINNTAVGTRALFRNERGSRNTAVGAQALSKGQGQSGSSTAVGYRALSEDANYYHSIGIGRGSGECFKPGELPRIVDSGTFLGNQTGFSYDFTAEAGQNYIFNVTAVGFGAIVDDHHQVRIGNSDVTSIGGFSSWSNLSDERYKSNVKENVAGLDFILKLRPVTYNMNVQKMAAEKGSQTMGNTEDEFYSESIHERMLKSQEEKSKIVYTGFVAQEVEAAAQELGFDFSGVDAPRHESGKYMLRYAEFVVPIVKAIQEQQAQIERLQPQAIEALQQELEGLKAAKEALLTENTELRTLVAELEASQTTLMEEQASVGERLLALQLENEQTTARVSDILSMMEAFGEAMQNCCSEQATSPGSFELHNNPARLEQNTPNPFSEHTLIRFYLPEGTKTARLVITNANGIQQKAVDLSGQEGQGQVIIHGGTLSSGTYIYSLWLDGRQVDSKRMVLL